MARLKPGQYGPDGKLKKNPEFQSAERIAENTRKATGKAPSMSTSTKSRPAGSPGGGFTNINNITQEDVLPEFRSELGFEEPITFGSVAKKVGGAIKDFVTRDFRAGIEAERGLPPGSVKGDTPLGPLLTTPQGIITGVKNILNIPAQIKRFSNAREAAAASNKIVGGVGDIQKINTGGKLTDWTKFLGDSPIKIESNSKAIALTEQMLKKRFNNRIMQVAGAWAGAVAIGKWGQAESGEPYSFLISQFAVPEAIRTGDWSTVNQLKADRKDLLDLPWWQEVLLWTAASPIIGIPKKIQGIAEAAHAQDAVLADMQIASETGETDEEMWNRINADRAAADKAATDYRNAQRLITEEQLSLNRAMEKAANDAEEKRILEETIKAWEESQDKERKAEAKERKANAEYWLLYQQEMAKLRAESAPSSLNFGLL